MRGVSHDPRSSRPQLAEPETAEPSTHTRRRALVTSDGAEGASGEPPPSIHRSQRGEVRVQLVSPSVLIIACYGFGDDELATLIEDAFDAAFPERSGIHVYLDCEALTGHDAAYRERIVAWAKRIHPRTATYCVLAHSRIVAFGVAVANALIGGHATTVTSRAAFATRIEISVRTSAGDR